MEAEGVKHVDEVPSEFRADGVDVAWEGSGGNAKDEGLVGVVGVYEGRKDRVFEEVGKLFEGEQHGGFLERDDIQ